MNPLTEEDIKEVAPCYGETRKVESKPIWENLMSTYKILAHHIVAESARELDAYLNRIVPVDDEVLNTRYHLTLFTYRLLGLMKEMGAKEDKPHTYAVTYTLDKLTLIAGRDWNNSRTILAFEVKGQKGIHVLNLNQYMKLLAKLLGKGLP